VQTILEQDPFGGHVFVFRGRRGDLIGLLWFDDDGLCLFAKSDVGNAFVKMNLLSGKLTAEDYWTMNNMGPRVFTRSGPRIRRCAFTSGSNRC
jgi:hypothetical protein